MSNHGIPRGAAALPSRTRNEHVAQKIEQDPYRSQTKPAEPAACPDCHAVFHAGRWQWLPAMDNANSVLCPACHRMRDRQPAGYLHVSGKFFIDYRDELLARINHLAEQEKSEHPLQRIMGIDGEDGGVLVTTTDVHLARRIADALHAAYQGTLEYQYSDGETLIRARWQR